MDEIVKIIYSTQYTIIMIDDSIPLWKVMSRIGDVIESERTKLSEYEVILATGSRTFAGGDIEKIYHLLTERYEIPILKIFSDATDQDEKGNIPVAINSMSKLESYISSSDSIESRITLFIKRTIRSGQTIDYKGHVVIYGNVNHGGVVRATGNITIFGKLYGSVWAGCGGDDNSFIVASSFMPTQIRVGSHVLTGAQIGKKGGEFGSSAAIVRGGLLQIIPIDEFIRGN